MTARHRFRVLAFSVIALAAALLAGRDAMANLTVAPIRVVMEGRQRTATLLLMNADNKPHTYRLGWKMQKADENGQYHELPLDPADPNIVPNMVVFSPRQIRIEAGGRQNIRLSLRQPANLPPGEYRAHLQFDALPDEEENGRVRDPSEKGAGLDIKFLIGLSVPVIVRTGGAPGEVTLENLSLQPIEGQPPGMKVEISHQKGANSAYGRLYVTSGDTQIGILNNVALFPEQEKRILMIPLTANPAPGAKLQVSYEGTGEYRGKLFAEKEIMVGQ